MAITYLKRGKPDAERAQDDAKIKVFKHFHFQLLVELLSM